VSRLFSPGPWPSRVIGMIELNATKARTPTTHSGNRLKYSRIINLPTNIEAICSTEFRDTGINCLYAKTKKTPGLTE